MPQPLAPVQTSSAPCRGSDAECPAPGDPLQPLWFSIVFALGPFKCTPTACVPETWGCTLPSPRGQLCCCPPGCPLWVQTHGLRLPHCPCLTGTGGSRPLRSARSGERRFLRAGSRSWLAAEDGSNGPRGSLSRKEIQPRVYSCNVPLPPPALSRLCPAPCPGWALTMLTTRLLHGAPDRFLTSCCLPAPAPCPGHPPRLARSHCCFSSASWLSGFAANCSRPEEEALLSDLTRVWSAGGRSCRG